MRPSTIVLDRSRQVAVQVYEILRERILAVELAPGALLVRGDIQEEFGVSQTPVRDALLRLQEEGLVDIFPQHATLVSRIDIGHAGRRSFCGCRWSSRRSAGWRPIRRLKRLPNWQRFWSSRTGLPTRRPTTGSMRWTVISTVCCTRAAAISACGA